MHRSDQHIACYLSLQDHQDACFFCSFYRRMQFCIIFPIRPLTLVVVYADDDDYYYNLTLALITKLFL